jgi:hypothetical protein
MDRLYLLAVFVRGMDALLSVCNELLAQQLGLQLCNGLLLVIEQLHGRASCDVIPWSHLSLHRPSIATLPLAV